MNIKFGIFLCIKKYENKDRNHEKSIWHAPVKFKDFLTFICNLLTCWIFVQLSLGQID